MIRANQQSLQKTILFMLCFILSGGILNAQFPKPAGYINDFANVISPEYESQMTELAREVQQKSSAEIAVVTVQNLGGSDLETYAARLFKSWGIGDKDRENGVLLLIALEERGVRIETGYGVESILPDGKTGEILDKYVLPYLKQGDFGKGAYQGMLAIADVIARDAGVRITGAAAPEAGSRDARKTRGGGNCFPVIFILLLIILTRGRIIPWLLIGGMGRGGGGFSGGGGSFGGGFGGFGGGMSGGGGASRGF